jgi:hypothetical protein
MAMTEHDEHRHVEAVRRYVTIGFWLVAAGAAATLGLELDGNAGS